MKKILFVFLLSSFSAISQSPVFKIDSIPTEGILLDKGWKFHAGDNPDFAKPDFDDSHWESIDPTEDVMDLKQFGDKYVGWFRLKINVDSSLFGQTFGLAVKQTGSSQVFMNEVLIKQIGQFSTIKQASKGYDPAGIAYRIPFGNKSLQVLSVKFEKPSIFLLKHIIYPNDCLKLRLLNTENIINNYLYNEPQDFIGLNFGYINSGIYFVIALFHLVLFIANKKSISNLLLFIYTFLVSLLFVLANFSFNSIDIDLRNYISTIILTIYPFLSFVALYAFYKLFEIKNKFILSISLLFSILSEVLLFGFYEWGYIIPQLIPFINGIFFYIIAHKAYKNGDKAAKYISLCIMFGIVFIVLALVFRKLLISYNLSPLLFHVLYNVGFLLQSGSIIFYFAFHFNKNWKNLELKLTEVQQLSQEKQETLQKQNSELQAALLKGQTTERQRVALDLHDNLGSTLTSIGFSMEAIDKSKMTDTEKDIYKNLQEMVTKAYNDVRLLSHNLLPEDFEKIGFTATLESFIRKINKNSTLQFHLNIDENFGRIDSKIEFELYSICLELVNNIIKHSKATEAKIELTRFEKQIRLTVSDNGIGLFKNDSDGKGMKNVQARVDAIGGVWKVKSIEGEGVVNEIVV